MKIACIGWGSLVWCPQPLHVVQGGFRTARCSQSSSPESPRTSESLSSSLPISSDSVLWALMSLTDLDAAKKDLAAREGIEENNIARSIGAVTGQSNPTNGAESELKRWLSIVGFEAAIWTNLKPKIGTDYRKPTIEEVIKHLREKVSHEQRANAEQYIRKTPRQIDTDYRRCIELEFGWLPI